MTDTSASPHARLRSVDIDAVRWTQGFWAERFDWCRKVVIPNMWRLLEDPNVSPAYENFLVAAGQKPGRHRGPKWHDGDFFKWLEAVAFVYATTHDKELDRQMDVIIEVIGKAQRADGYIHTPVLIAQRQHLPQAGEFGNRPDFETYNMGHLMTCACLHYRATGKTSLLDIAKKATDFLYRTYKDSPDTLANNAICPGPSQACLAERCQMPPIVNGPVPRRLTPHYHVSGSRNRSVCCLARRASTGRKAMCQSAALVCHVPCRRRFSPGSLG